MGLGIAAQSYGARYFNNDAKPTGGWIEYPGRFADKAARTMFRDSVQAAQGDANRGKMMVLDSGMKYHEVGISNKDGQFLESRQFQISEIARWFGIPPHKLADLSRATFSNIEQQSLEYIHDGLLYWSEVWKHAIESDILFDHEKLEAEFSFSKLLRGDSTARYGNYAKGIAAGWLTRNEAREDDGREPLEGLDEPLRPLNMVEEAAAEDEESDAENADDAEDAKSPAPESDESLAVSRATASTWIAGSAAALKSTSVADLTAELITLASQP
jgi:HK97 family phage portal protein